MTMLFPQGTDYNVAVQHPRRAFADPHLRDCVAETTPLGLPRPFSGGFTTTYRLVNHKLGYDWAVRCFTRDIPDLEARYQALERFFDRHHAEPAFVKTWHLPKGIHVAEKWHPAIKMQWIEGTLLDGYVRSKLNEPRAIEKLAYEFADLIGRLERIGFAHGDLQHGNILIRDGRISLIDYDGSCVPESAALGTNNFGHVNYQHPGRSESRSDARIDRFSAIVIYLGLMSVAAQPALWRDFDNGENILFRRTDFVNVDQSALLARLSSLQPVAHLVNRFRQICRFNPQDVPSLDAFVRGDFSAPPVQPVKREPWYGRRSQYPIIDCNQRETLLQHVGNRIEALGCVSGVFENQEDPFPYQFLNLGRDSYPNHGLTLVLWTEGLQSFRSANREPWKLMNKWVSVTGVVSVHKAHGRLVPQIIVDHQSQIQELADGANEARARLAAYALDPEGISATLNVSRPVQRWQELGDSQHEAEAKLVFDKLYGNNAPGTKTTALGLEENAPTQSGALAKPQPRPQPQTASHAPWYSIHILGHVKSQSHVIGAGNLGSVASSMSTPASATPLLPPARRVQLAGGWRKLRQRLASAAAAVRQHFG